MTAIALGSGLSGCASLDTSDHFVARWGMRGAGALTSFALHEACHVALGAALGGSVEASFRAGSPYLEFSDLSRNEHQAVSVAGNACTGLAAEVIVDTSAHRKSNFAWGAAAFHAINAFGYAWSNSGDANYWEKSGGSRATWQALNATHSSRIGAQLAWDSDFGNYLKERWRVGPPAPFPDFGLDEATPIGVPSIEPSLLAGLTDTKTDLVLNSLESLPVPASLDLSVD
jgi:hypothetical protein